MHSWSLSRRIFLLAPQRIADGYVHLNDLQVSAWTGMIIKFIRKHYLNKEGEQMKYRTMGRWGGAVIDDWSWFLGTRYDSEQG